MSLLIRLVVPDCFGIPQIPVVETKLQELACQLRGEMQLAAIDVVQGFVEPPPAVDAVRAAVADLAIDEEGG